MRAGLGPSTFGPIVRLFTEGTLAGLSELELLERYLRHRDDAAFRVLVDRHGPMVLAVCRQILGNTADADDAFQATFLLLARKGHQVRRSAWLGPWLHRVAHRVAWRASTLARRRRAREQVGVEFLPEVPHPDSRPDPDHAVIHREIDRLPETYRRVVLLCDLEGLTHAEAAERLRWPIGTVKGRLSRARERLRGRLTRLGLAPAGLAAIATLSTSARAAVPPSLAVLALETVTSLASRSVPTAAATTTIAAQRLAQGVTSTMLWLKIQWTVAVGLTLLAAGFGGLAAAGRFQDKPAQATPTPTADRGLGVRETSLVGKWRRTSTNGKAMPDKPAVVMMLLRPTLKDLRAFFPASSHTLVAQFLTGEPGLPGVSHEELVVIDEQDKHSYLDFYAFTALAEDVLQPKLRGIYRLEGDTLTVSMEPASRPTGLEPIAGGPRVVDVYQRVREEGPPQPDPPALPAPAAQLPDALRGDWLRVATDGQPVAEAVTVSFAPSDRRPAPGLPLPGGAPKTLELGIVLRMRHQFTSRPDAPVDFLAVLDPAAVPTPVDLYLDAPEVPGGLPMLGALRLDGDVLSIVYRGKFGARPATFTADPERGVTLDVYVRSRPGVKPPRPQTARQVEVEAADNQDPIAALEGTWRLTTDDGQGPPQDELDLLTLMRSQGSLRHLLEERGVPFLATFRSSTPTKGLSQRQQFVTVKTNANPRHFDLYEIAAVNRGDMTPGSKGVYRIEGETLTILSGSVRDRPTGFGPDQAEVTRVQRYRRHEQPAPAPGRVP